MQSFSSNTIFSLFLQILGIVVDGICGIGFEMMKVMLSDKKGNNIIRFFIQKLIIIVVIEVSIDLLCGDASMIAETGWWMLEKLSWMILQQIRLFVSCVIYAFSFLLTPLHMVIPFLFLSASKKLFLPNGAAQISPYQKYDPIS